MVCIGVISFSSLWRGFWKMSVHRKLPFRGMMRNVFPGIMRASFPARGGILRRQLSQFFSIGDSNGHAQHRTLNAYSVTTTYRHDEFVFHHHPNVTIMSPRHHTPLLSAVRRSSEAQRKCHPSQKYRHTPSQSCPSVANNTFESTMGPSCSQVQAVS